MTSISIIIGAGYYVLGIVLTGFVLFTLWLQYIPWLHFLIPTPIQPPDEESQETSHIRE